MKILMVCLGNICRSPLAHGVMQALIDERGLDWQVDSAGTSSWSIGRSPDRRAIQVAKKYHVDISKQRAQWFRPHLFERFDKILVMDRQNYHDVLALANGQEQRSKVLLFLGEDEVPDPYYDDALFDPVYNMIRQRAEILLSQWVLELNTTKK